MQLHARVHTSPRSGPKNLFLCKGNLPPKYFFRSASAMTMAGAVVPRRFSTSYDQTCIASSMASQFWRHNAIPMSARPPCTPWPGRRHTPGRVCPATDVWKAYRQRRQLMESSSMQYVRDSAMIALIFGFFASSWFGWAQERPPLAWRPPLIAGSVVSLAVAVFGAVLAWQGWSDGSALSEPGAMRRYGIIVGVEFGIAAAGAFGLAALGHSIYISPWICLVVGVHFWPMAPLLKNPSLIVVGVLMTAVAMTAVLVSRRTPLAPSAVTGVGAGVVLLGFAIWGAVSAIA